MLRRIGLSLFLFGLVGLWAYPVWYSTYYNVDLGTYRIHDADSGFRTVAGIALSPDAGPLRIDIAGRAATVPEATDAATTFTMVVNAPDGTVAAEVLRIEAVGDAGRIDLPPVTVAEPGSGEHVFVFGEGDVSEVPLGFLDMTLTGAAAAPDWRVQPVSAALVGIGLLLIVWGLMRRRRRRPPPSGPARRRGSKTSDIGRRVPLDADDRPSGKPARRWGRGG